MRKSPEGKWQKPSVPLDGATLAVMQEYVRMQWASLSTDMRLSCFPCFDWMIRPAVRSCLISRNPPFDRPMKQKWGDWVKNKKKQQKYVFVIVKQLNVRVDLSERFFKREEPHGVGIERMRHVTSKPRNLPRRSESSQQVKPSGANSPETLDLSELIRPREA